MTSSARQRRATANRAARRQCLGVQKARARKLRRQVEDVSSKAVLGLSVIVLGLTIFLQ